MRIHGIWLLATALLQAQTPDAAIVPLLRNAAPGVFQVRVLKRVPVDPELDLVIAIGMPKTYQPGTGASFSWDSNVLLGLFLQSRDKPATVYKIAIEAGHADGDCFSRLERATATGVVLSCRPEKGNAGPNRKFAYDIHAKALVGQLEYQRLPLTRIVAAGESAVLLGEEVAVRYAPAAVSPFRLLNSAEGERWVTSAAQPEAAKPSPLLPRTTYEEFARARPARVKNGYTRETAMISEEIGPTQLVNSTLWFGKSFSDSEGSTGVGGFGYFDAQQRRYKIYSPPEIADWAVSALLVEPDTVWLALVTRGEFRDSSGGLLRFDRATEKVTKIELPDIANSIVRVGNRLLLATEFGTALVEDGVVRRFFVDKTTDGRLRIAEAALGN